MRFRKKKEKFRSNSSPRVSSKTSLEQWRVQNPPCIPLNTNLMKKRFHRRCCRPAKRRTPVNDRIRPFQQNLGRGKRGSPASCLAFSLSLSPPRTRLHRVSPLARASRNFNEASCGSQIREIVSRPARRSRHHFSTRHHTARRCLRP